MMNWIKNLFKKEKPIILTSVSFKDGKLLFTTSGPLSLSDCRFTDSVAVYATNVSALNCTFEQGIKATGDLTAFSCVAMPSPYDGVAFHGNTTGFMLGGNNDVRE